MYWKSGIGEIKGENMPEVREPIFAVVTPFSPSAGLPVDTGALEELLAFVQQCGVRRIIAGGTTGEFSSLTLPERRRVLETCRKAFDGEVIAHVSSTCAGEVRELAGHAAGHADALLLLPPYYYADAPPAGVIEFFLHAAADTPLPCYLYNFPRHTQIPLAPDTVAAVRGRMPQLRGIKDSGGQLAHALSYREACGPNFEVYLGADGLALDVLCAGLDGSVTGGAQPVPELLIAVAGAWKAEDREGASAAQERLNSWTAARKVAGLAEPAILKAALGERLPGFPAAVRPPLLSATPEQQSQLRGEVRRFLPRSPGS